MDDFAFWMAALVMAVGVATVVAPWWWRRAIRSRLMRPSIATEAIATAETLPEPTGVEFVFRNRYPFVIREDHAAGHTEVEYTTTYYVMVRTASYADPPSRLRLRMQCDCRVVNPHNFFVYKPVSIKLKARDADDEPDDVVHSDTTFFTLIEQHYKARSYRDKTGDVEWSSQWIARLIKANGDLITLGQYVNEDITVLLIGNMGKIRAEQKVTMRFKDWKLSIC